MENEREKTFIIIIIIIFRVTNGLGFWRETERDERDEHYSEDDDEEEK